VEAAPQPSDNTHSNASSAAATENQNSIPPEPSSHETQDIKRWFCIVLTPLMYSITSTRYKEMVLYLYMNTTDEGPGCPFSGPSASQLVALLTAAGYHGIY
jgi:hypothetical protein